ncbi:hypothetical protein [Microbacterium kribbense]|uniref:hypothetical protein n=1 Tax=Microbacterium kribbense TaxID=433645 RepID=UPI0031D39802
MQLYGDTRENVDYRCIVDGSPAGVAATENALISARVTLVPMGRLCTWHAANGGVVLDQSGWPLTLVFLGCSALAVAFTTYGALKRYASGLVPLAVLAAFWLGILAYVNV